MKVIGTKRDDFLGGSSGNDVIKGPGGDDFIRSGGDGLDILKGGKGADTFVVNVDQFALIKDFKPGQDQIIPVDELNPQVEGATPLDPADFGTHVNFTNGVIEYNNTPVVAVGGVALSADDLLLN